MTEDEQRGLVDSAKSGSSYALSRLLQENYEAVYRYLLKITLDAEISADITQECMLKVISRFALYDPSRAALSTWMIAIARNLWIEECRKAKRRRKIPEEPEQDPAEDPVGRIIESDDMLRALKKLGDRLRIPVILRHCEGYSYREISKMLKIPQGTVKSRVFKGIQVLRKELEGDE